MSRKPVASRLFENVNVSVKKCLRSPEKTEKSCKNPDAMLI